MFKYDGNNLDYSEWWKQGEDTEEQSIYESCIQYQREKMGERFTHMVNYFIDQRLSLMKEFGINSSVDFYSDIDYEIGRIFAKSMSDFFDKRRGLK